MSISAAKIHIYIYSAIQIYRVNSLMLFCVNFRFVVSTTMSGLPAPRPTARPAEDKVTRLPPGFGPIPGIQRALPRYCLRKVKIFIEEQELPTCLLMWLMRMQCAWPTLVVALWSLWIISVLQSCGTESECPAKSKCRPWLVPLLRATASFHWVWTCDICMLTYILSYFLYATYIKCGSLNIHHFL